MDSRTIAETINTALRTGEPIPESLRSKVRDVRRDDVPQMTGPDRITVTLEDGNEFTITVEHTNDGRNWK